MKEVLTEVVMIFVISGCVQLNNNFQVQITDFDSCVAAGNAVMETYPEHCRTADGRVFVRDVGAECSSVKPCPQIYCFLAPCLQYQCVSGRCMPVGQVEMSSCGNHICEAGEAARCPACTYSEPRCMIACQQGTCPQDCDSSAELATINDELLCKQAGGSWNCVSPCAPDAMVCVAMCKMVCEAVI